jgi:hypothetical protein
MPFSPAEGSKGSGGVGTDRLLVDHGVDDGIRENIRNMAAKVAPRRVP